MQNRFKDTWPARIVSGTIGVVVAILYVFVIVGLFARAGVEWAAAPGRRLSTLVVIVWLGAVVAAGLLP